MSSVAFRDQKAAAGNAASAGTEFTALPALAAGDLLLASVGVAIGAATIAPTTPNGWNVLGQSISQGGGNGQGAWFYYRWADAKTDTIPVIAYGTQLKYAISVASWSGGDGKSVPLFKAGQDPQVSSRNHVTPTLATKQDTWDIEVASIKSSTNTSYAVPGGLVTRSQAYGTGSGIADIIVCDSNGDVAASNVGGHTLVSAIASVVGVTATISIPPAFVGWGVPL